MSSSSRRSVRLAWLVASLAWAGLAAPAWSAESVAFEGTKTTQLVIRLATGDIVAVESRFHQQPPTLVLLFPPRRVTATLPERSVLPQGVVREIRAEYVTSPHTAGGRWLRALRIQLEGRYPYQVHAQAGRILVSIDHPARVIGQDLDVGLAGGSIWSGAADPSFSERFHAMQRALSGAASPVLAAPHASSPSWPPESSGEMRSEHLTLTDGTINGLGMAGFPPEESLVPAVPVATKTAPRAASAPARASRGWGWLLGWLGILGAGAWLWQGALGRWRGGRTRTQERRLSGSAGIRLIDQLVFGAFERQGHQLLHTIELGDALGSMRIIMKERQKAALLCVGTGAFFEKTTVEHFVRSMHQAKVEAGYLVAPGSFTVPAQRYAKAHGVTLIGRDQLMELLSIGAMNERYTKQIEQVQGQLKEAKATLEQYAQQLDLLRRQRNEASWFLGEERVKSSRLETQLAALNEQLLQAQAHTDQTRQTAENLRKQWEESQWYLGESKAALQHVEEEMRVLREAFEALETRHRETTERLQEVDRQRGESTWQLGEAKASSETFQEQVRHLEEQLAQATAQLASAGEALAKSRQQMEEEQIRRKNLEEELLAIRLYGERRKFPRLFRSDATVTLNDYTGSTVFEGPPRDISLSGFGLDSPTPIEFPETLPLQIRYTLPGRERPIESSGRIVWKRRHPSTNRYQAGFELEGVPSATRRELEEAFGAAPRRRRVRSKGSRSLTPSVVP